MSCPGGAAVGYRAFLVSGIALALLTAPALSAAERPLQLSFAGNFKPLATDSSETPAPAARSVRAPSRVATRGGRTGPRMGALGLRLDTGFRLETGLGQNSDWDYQAPGDTLFGSGASSDTLGREIAPQLTVSLESGANRGGAGASAQNTLDEKASSLMRRFGANLAYALTDELDLCVNYRYRAIESDKAQLVALTTRGAALTEVAPVLSTKDFKEQAVLFGIRWHAW
jgi:hypothetical protein